MDNLIIFVVLALFMSSTRSLPPRQSKQYRSDYEYNSRSDAFYKLHTEARKSLQASKVCLVEGATLMVPGHPEDMKQLHAMFKRFPDLGDYVWVGLDGGEHESAEEKPIIELNQDESGNESDVRCDVVDRHGQVDSYHCFQRLPFICKVQANNAPYDSHCDVFSNDYHYNSTVGSCYRIPPVPLTWNEGYAECSAQNAHLVILNSETERAVVQGVMMSTPRLKDSQSPWYFFAGFRAKKPLGNEKAVFRTIFNQTLEEAGFTKWSATEPNNYGGREYCGSLYEDDGNLNDISCDYEVGFICEKEKNSQS